MASFTRQYHVPILPAANLAEGVLVENLIVVLGSIARPFAFDARWVADSTLLKFWYVFILVHFLHLVRLVVVTAIAGVLVVTFLVAGLTGYLALPAMVQAEEMAGQLRRNPGSCHVAA